MQLVAYGAQDIYLTGNVGVYNSRIPHIKKKAKQIKPRIKSIKKFKNFRKHDKYDQHTCCICLDKHRSEDYVAVRHCGHIYHEACNNVQLIECPICRRL